MKRIFKRDCFLKKEWNFRGEKEGIFSGKERLKRQKIAK